MHFNISVNILCSIPLRGGGEQTVLCFDKMAAVHPVQENHVVKSHHCTVRNPPPPTHLFYDFFFAVWLLIIDWCNGFSSLLLCAQNINAFFPLGAAQAGAIDVISFLEARGEDPVAIQCLSAVLKR